MEYPTDGQDSSSMSEKNICMEIPGLPVVSVKCEDTEEEFQVSSESPKENCNSFHFVEVKHEPADEVQQDWSPDSSNQEVDNIHRHLPHDTDPTQNNIHVKHENDIEDEAEFSSEAATKVHIKAVEEEVSEDHHICDSDIVLKDSEQYILGTKDNDFLLESSSSSSYKEPIGRINKLTDKNIKNSGGRVKKTIECPVCHKIFNFIRNLQRHMSIHTGVSLLECPICGKCFTKKGHFEEHRTVHSDARPHQCQVCYKTFKCKATLARHSRLHSSNHPHHCPICNKVFTTRQHLHRHIQTHTGEKPFKCHICPSVFSQSSSLTRHLVIHSGQKSHICSICNKAFSFQNDLKIHTRIHTGEKPYSCPLCNKSFTQKGNLVLHMRVHKAK